MKHRLALAAVGLLTLSIVGVGSAGAVEEAPGTSPDNPIVVTDPSEVPQGAVEDETSTYDTPEACDTTRSWVLTIPANEETSHEEFRYLRVMPGQYHEAVTHQEFRYQRTVEDTTTQYHFRKFTHIKTRTYTPGTDEVRSPEVWANWAPSNTQGPQDYTPIWPSDERGKWIVHDQGIPPGHAGPDGVYQQGGGNSPFFYRQNSVVITPATEGGWGPWSDFGPWTPWEPATHQSWETSTDPLGVPQFHGSGTYSDGTQWYREWQAQFDGETREVSAGTHVETSEGWLTAPPAGDGWEVIETRTVTDAEAYTDPDVTLYFTGGEPSLDAADAIWLLAEQAPEGWTQFDERTVGNEDGTPEVVTYYAYTDGAECEKPEGFKDSTSEEKCDNGNLVTTTSTTTGTPVQAEDGSWTIEETATSSQSVEKNAEDCSTTPPVTPPTPPSNHLTSLPMTGREAGTTVSTPGTSPWGLYGGAAALLAGLMGLTLTTRRRSA